MIIYGTTSNPYITSVIEWDYTQDIDGNTSTVTATLYYRKNNTSKTYGTGTFSISIDGKKTTESKYIEITDDGWVKAISAKQTISHNSDGAKSFTISASGSISGTTLQSTSCSGTFDLSIIPRASTITSASNKTLVDACAVTWTPLSTAFRYKLKFALGTWEDTTDVIHPNTTSSYTYTGYEFPIEVAEQFPNATSGTMTATLYTYSDSDATIQVGSTSSNTFTVAIPNNSSTQPVVTMSLAPIHSLNSKFASVYVQGKSKVQATLSAEGKYGASIDESSYKMSALGKTDSSSPYQSDYLTTTGTVKVTGYATDSRGFTGTKTQDITVIPYSKPKIIPASGESSIICARCDANGNLSESGTYLKIKAKRSYSKVESGTQLNFCAIRYRCKPSTNASFTDADWVTILAKNSTSDEIITNPIANVVSDASISYIVEVGVVDDIGESSSFKITVPTSLIDFHLKEGGRGAAFGKYAEKEKCLEIAPDWDVTGRVYGLGKCKETLPKNADINSYTEFGVYSIPSNDYAATMSNLPITLAGLLIVSSAVGDGNSSGTWAYIKQRFESLDGKHEYHRIVRTGSVAGVYMYDEWIRRGNTNWSGLSLSSSVSQSNQAIGRHTNGNCWYRVVNENHVYITFNCAFTFSGSEIQVNANALPWEYRPKRNVYAMCPTNDRGIARVLVTTEGNVIVHYVQSIASSTVTTSYGVTWIDGYIDFWV
jgi:hypothetical protein